ncbi:hypothetical protein [Candidatus Rhabdochlamydia sp. T3358]|uniref:hypothetical protein n=1 Tax=Candidatus Rhabdochlamydia sp. T3358 TaxID=2099795 RepID=UPI0010B8BC7B|nr:hypothetical protein [Candidatus Rhabdochlamydia sp. T3358]VHO02615.1 hypothetical protein RHT_00551 [Candidatus Rhabdochlamydia sp. T3358]
MNYINWFKHSIFSSETDHCRYDLDLPEAPGEDYKLRRIALATIPFVALYRPAGTALSLGMGSCRVISHLKLTYYEEKKEWKNISKEVAQTALAIVSLTSSILNIKMGQLLTSSLDTAQGTYSIIYYAVQEKYDKAAEEALQTLASGLYVAFILTGSLEIILLSVLFQTALQLYQMKEEISKQHYIEAAAKLGMAAMRLNQANNYRGLIQKRNALFALQKHQSLISQALKGRSARHLLHHNLIDLNGKIDENKVSLSNQEKEYDFGSHFHGYGKGLVKGANLAFRTVVIDGKELTECEFKVNHVFREKLQETINQLQMLNSSEICDILQLTGSHAQSLYIEEHKESNNYDPYKEIYQIIVSGLGEIHIGASRDYPNLFDRVVVLMDREKNLFDLYELLSLADLDTAITSSLKEDLDRLKTGHLFRIFFPKEATTFERSEAFFTLPTRELLDKMIEKSPEMREIYNKYFHQIQETEILPGRIRYKIKGLSDEIQKSGGCHLTAAVTGAYTNQQSLYQRAASMLSMGMLSQEIKAKLQINKTGGPGWDYCSGGADSIYTQMLTIKDAVSESFNTNHLDYQSKVRVLISLDALETGTYQHLKNSFGSRLVNHESMLGQPEGTYLNRPNILEFTKTIQQKRFDENNWSGHEIMLKERIDPSYFKGFLVSDEETRNGLLNHLRTCNLVQKDSLNRETIQGHLVQDFIRVSPLKAEPDFIKASRL